MATRISCPSCHSTLPLQHALSRISLIDRVRATTTPFNANGQIRTAATQLKKKVATPRKKKTRNSFLIPDLRPVTKYTLVDAMRYIRAAEVGQRPTSAKYELHIRLKTLRSGAVVRGRLRLPHAVRTDARICVIAAPDSPAGQAAAAAGAQLIGEETVFDAVKEGRIEFERCICHQDSLPKLSKANLGRILGPKGLMPSTKLGTVVKDVASAVKNMVGGSEYRERAGVIRMAVGQLGFTPEELQTNIRTFMDALKKDFSQISDRSNKDIHEVVLSSTRGPGLTLSGSLRSTTSADIRDLSTL